MNKCLFKLNHNVGGSRQPLPLAMVVVDGGSKGNSFTAITTMRRDQGAGAGSTIFTLVVKEYADAPKKPFMFLSDVTVYFGNCVHF